MFPIVRALDLTSCSISRIGKTVFSSVKCLKGLMLEFMAAKKVRKFPGFVIYSNFKDSAFTAVKRDATSCKFNLVGKAPWGRGCCKRRYVKMVPFVNTRYTKGVPFLSKIVYKRGSQGG